MATPLLTATPGAPPTYNPSMAETFSWIPVEGAGRPLFAQATYLANPEDIKVSLSADNINVSLDELELNTDQLEGLVQTVNQNVSASNLKSYTQTVTNLVSSVTLPTCYVVEIYGCSFAGYDQYLQIVNSNNSLPVFVGKLKANENFAFNFTTGIILSSTGMIKNSLTPLTYTQALEDINLTIKYLI